MPNVAPRLGTVGPRLDRGWPAIGRFPGKVILYNPQVQKYVQALSQKVFRYFVHVSYRPAKFRDSSRPPPPPPGSSATHHPPERGTNAALCGGRQAAAASCRELREGLAPPKWRQLALQLLQDLGTRGVSMWDLWEPRIGGSPRFFVIGRRETGAPLCFRAGRRWKPKTERSADLGDEAERETTGERRAHPRF